MTPEQREFAAEVIEMLITELRTQGLVLAPAEAGGHRKGPPRIATVKKPTAAQRRAAAAALRHLDSGGRRA